MFRHAVDADAWQVKFRSTDTHGAAASGVTTVIIPRRRFDGSVGPTLSYPCAIGSLGAAADPSYTLSQGDQGELPLMLLALHRGWAVVTTDYTGPRHAFAAGLVAARSCSMAFGRRILLTAALSALHARYRRRPPLAATSRAIVDGARPTRAAIARND